MNIFLFGVSNVGKSVIGELLAEYLDYLFFDIDDLVKEELGITLEEFVSTGSLPERDRLRCDIIHSLTYIKADKVIAVTPLSHIHDILPLLSSPNVMAIELTDSVENIFDRLVFSDENDIIYQDDDYKYAHSDYYLSEIKKDLDWYGSVYAILEHHFDIAGRTPEETALALIETFHLKDRNNQAGG